MSNAKLKIPMTNEKTLSSAGVQNSVFSMRQEAKYSTYA